MIAEALETVRQASERPVLGWLSPSLSESSRTPDLLAEYGVEYLCDWVNDDLPYRFHAGGGSLYAMPYSVEINDLTVLCQLNHSAAEFQEQVVEQFEFLRGESEMCGGRVMCIALHPWIVGVPHRIAYLDRALETILASPAVWPATGSEILQAFRSQEGGTREPRG